MVSASLVTNHETQGTKLGYQNFYRKGTFPSISINCLINRGIKDKEKGTDRHIQITKRRIINM